MPNPKFLVSSRATKGGPTQQVTIPAAIARKLPQGKSIRWEVSVVKGGLFYKYIGTEDKIDTAPEVELDFVPAADLKGGKKAAAKPAAPAPVEAEVKAHPETVIDGTTVVVGEDEGTPIEVEDDPATDSTAEQEDDAVVDLPTPEEALDEAPF